MANYSTLKTAIQAVIRTNGNEEITGALLQQSLLAMIDSLGAGYQFMGVATTNTVPGTPDQDVFYLAFDAGTYTNFGGTSLGNGQIGVFSYNGNWTYIVKTIGQGGGGGGVSDVTVGGTSVVNAQGVAVVPAIPSAPGTLQTDITTAQTASASEALSGAIKLHKVSKTGSYGDLLNKPTIDATPTSASTNLVTSGGVYSAMADRYTKTELAAMAETWTFTLDDDSTVTKKIIVLPNS